MRHFIVNTLRRQRRQEIKEKRAVAGSQAIADTRRHRVDQTAFNTCRCQQALTRAPIDTPILSRQTDRHGFQRFARKTTAEVLAPVDIETAIRRLERRYTHVACFQMWNPRGIRAKSWPTRAAEREHDCISFDRPLAVRRSEPQEG